MMNTVIFYVNPSKSGHCGAMLEELEKKLTEQRESYQVVDLYEDGFSPILQSSDLSPNQLKDPAIFRYQGIITASSNIVFIFPIWWGGLPAMLKGFFDRVFSSGFAFVYKGGIPVGLLKGKKALVLCSAAAPGFYSAFIYRNIVLKVLRRQILGFCGCNTKGFILSGARGAISDLKRKRVANIIKRSLAFIK